MAHEFKLPAIIVGPADITRLKRELTAFNEDQQQADLQAKSSGKVKAEVTKPGRLLQEVATSNDFNLSVSEQRTTLLGYLEEMLTEAPTITMSFAVDPSAAFMSKVVEWLRESIHPHVLVRIGLQPNIAAGCILRTPSKIYDFSLRGKFTEQRPMLIKRLHESNQPKATSLKAPSQEAPA